MSAVMTKQQEPVASVTGKHDVRSDVLELEPHRSSLPTALYLLSFAPPLPSLFREPVAFAKHPLILYAIGFIAACAAGVGMPALDILYGFWSNRVTPSASSPQLITQSSSQTAWIMTVVAVVVVGLSWLFLTCFSLASHALTVRLRHTYVASTIVQDQAFFDLVGPGEISSRAGKDVSTVRTGLGEKIAFLIWSLATVVTGLVSAFIHASRFAGVLFSLLPFTIIIFAILGWATDLLGAPALAVQGKTASLSEQMLSSVRIVQAFGMAPQLIRRLNEGMLSKLERLGLMRSLVHGIEQSAIYFVLNVSYAICFWYGSIQVARGDSVGSILTAFWNLINSLFALANAVPHLSGIFDAFTALALLRKHIERKPAIDVRDQTGLCDGDVDGDGDDDSSAGSPAFELRSVTFAYPSRASTRSLDGVSVTIERGKMTAFVGPSGSGKSTIASLFLREYDPETCNWRNPVDPLPEDEQKELDEAKKSRSEDKSPLAVLRRLTGKKAAQPSEGVAESQIEKQAEELSLKRVVGAGQVLYRGHDVRQYNLRWLRSQIAVVSQHPQLFTASVFENVAAGLSGTPWEYRSGIDDQVEGNDKAQARLETIREKCVQALQKADAWTFVSKLPQGMDTLVSGGRSGVLSGGQRQRVAIARALIRQPKVLILDEGTSALDSATEDRIKLMLEQEQRENGMTVIIIAHRLSTIAAADKIVVLVGGQIKDQGLYNDLMEENRDDPTFREMVLAQQAVIKAYGSDDEDDSADARAITPNSDDVSSLRQTRDHSQHAASLMECSTIAPTLAPNSSAVSAVGLNAPRPAERVAQNSSEQAQRPVRSSLRASYSGRGPGTSHPTEPAAGLSDAATGSRDANRAIEHKDKSRASSDIESAGDASKAVSTVGDDDNISGDHVKFRLGQGLFRKFCRVAAVRKWYFVIGLLGAIIGGTSFPLAGYLTGRAVDSLRIEGDDARMRHESDRWALWFFVIASADLFIFLINAFFLELASETVVRKLKIDGLTALLRQEVGFFDQQDTASGALASAISSHPSNVGAASGLILSQVVLSLTNLIGSLILGLVLSWKATLVCFAPVLVLFLSGFAEVAMLEKYEAAASKPVARAAAYINEAMDTIRTVAALGRESEIMRTFDSEARSDKHRNKYLMLGALGFAASQGMVLFLAALVFYWGGKLLADNQLSVAALYAVFEAVIIGAFSAGRLFTYVGDYSRAFSSFSILQAWMSRKPRVASIEPKWSQESRSVEPENEKGQLRHPCEGVIEFTNVEMRYPQRPEQPALRCLNLRIQPGSNVAFCGTSGSGKSSILALLQRFYDPSKGTITFGGTDSRAMSLDELRSGMAYVSQDPVLFEGSVRWNLTLGSTDPDNVTDAQVEAACQQACILDFINGLEKGFETDIGMKGAQLSGGQKQRLCIARALLRNAPILCLDEATSALDPTSEKSVQRALDLASIGRTTVTIAHRLSTIRNADVIHVVEDGAIVESGTHDELLAREGGRYRDLVAAQL
ncbi:unnamed protein product [Parajaminaea phylloscopi]